MTTSIFSDQIPGLLQTHFDQLHIGSGIAVEVIKKRGYFSALGRKELEDLGFSKAQQRTPSLVIPLHGPSGDNAGHQIRPDNPRRNSRTSKEIKYETQRGGTLRLDIPVRFRQQVKDPSIPLWWTEGAKKADAAATHGLCCINLSGVWGFKSKNIFGGVTVSADMDDIALADRECTIAFDSDIIDKAEVKQAMERLAEHLLRRKAIVYIVRLASGLDDKKVGLDDYLLTHTVEQLEALRELYEAEDEPVRNYECREAGVGYKNEDGQWQPIIPVPTSIVSMEMEAEGEAGANYTLLVQTDDGNRALHLTASQMADGRSLRAAFLAVGIALVPRREHHVAPALLATSGDYARIRLYHRIGWAKGNYIAPGQEPKGVKVSLPHRVFANLGTGKPDDARESMLGLLAAMPEEQTTIAVAHAFLAPLSRPAGLDRYKYALHITGRTGTFKTSFACCLMALWAGEDWVMQPILKWGEGATNNAIVAHAAHLADSLILIDNFKPSTGGGSRAFIGLIHNIVEGAEKERLTRTSQLRQSREIHAWPLTTGEDVPREDAASMARMLVMHFTWPGGHNAKLAQAQAKAAHLPALMRSWIAWIKANPETVKALGETMERRRDRWAQWLMVYRPKTINILRLATNLSMQEIAWEAMSLCDDLQFITNRRAEVHRRGLEQIALEMGAATAESLEANVWLGALSDLAGSGVAYMRGLNGSVPVPTPDRTTKAIGWQDDDFLYLLPTITHDLIRESLRRAGQPLNVSATTLYKQLKSLGALAASTGDTNLFSKKINGKTHRLICLYRRAIEYDDPLDDADSEEKGGYSY